jgi:hypothetical protein
LALRVHSVDAALPGFVPASEEELERKHPVNTANAELLSANSHVVFSD